MDGWMDGGNYDIEVTDQPLWAAALHIRLPMWCVSLSLYDVVVYFVQSKQRIIVNCVPRNPFPPHTTSFLFAAAVEAIGAIVFHAVSHGVRNCIQFVVGQE